MISEVLIKNDRTGMTLGNNSSGGRERDGKGGESLTHVWHRGMDRGAVESEHKT